MSPLTKLKRVVDMRAGGTPSVDDPLLWDDEGLPWVAIADMSKEPTVTRTDRRVSQAGVIAKNLPIGNQGTLLFAMYASVGAVSTLGTQGSWNQAILGIHPRFGLADSRFARYWLEHLKPNLSALFRSNTQDNLNAEQVGNLPFPVLAISRQSAIADYLDRETTRIDALVAAKRRVLGLLEERRAATIARLVTPPTGATNWRHLRLRHVVHRIIDTEHKTVPFYEDGEFLVARTTNVRRGRLVTGPDSKFTDEDGYREWTMRSVPEPGDIIFTREAPAGEACIVPPGLKVCIGQRTVLLKVDESRISAPYCLWSLYGGISRSFVDELSQGSTVAHLNMSDIPDIPLWVPEIPEQHAIAERLERVTAKIDETMGAIERQIELILEHRQALISAAVTGTIDLSGS